MIGFGWVTERLIVHAWKACVPKGTGGSNPPPSGPASRLRFAGSVVETVKTITIGRILPIAVLPDYLLGSVLG
jgi:hypothetical protein